MSKKSITFQQLLSTSKNPIGMCVTLVMCWLMVCDEKITDEEMEYLKAVAPPENIHFFSEFINQNKASQIHSIFYACKLLDKALDSDRKRYLIELLLGMMIADNRVSITELHIVRFVADLFYINPEVLNNIYVSLTGKELPEPGDPSSIDWWKTKERQHKQQEEKVHNGIHIKYSEERRDWAYSVLGLNENSSLSEIKDAFHKLCHIHHPDRFEKLGPEATRAANVIFTKINQAYSILVEE